MTYMNHVSDNLSAENILKTLAAEKTGPPGSAEAGAEVVKHFLAGIGIDTTHIVIADGSGVSRYDLTTAGTITTLLAAMRRRADLFPFVVRDVSGGRAERHNFRQDAGNARAGEPARKDRDA